MVPVLLPPNHEISEFWGSSGLFVSHYEQGNLSVERRKASSNWSGAEAEPSKQASWISFLSFNPISQHQTYDHEKTVIQGQGLRTRWVEREEVGEGSPRWKGPKPGKTRSLNTCSRRGGARWRWPGWGLGQPAPSHPILYFQGKQKLETRKTRF